ncbi:MAG: hypothetical protein K5768_03510 [Firmicutes bacterium]|nr:hypothetical protein [Bacillota bacterium]
MIYLGKRREMFWDSYLVDEEKTTAFSRLMEPIFKETCFWLDKGKELKLASYPCILKDKNGYKMYYTVWTMREDLSASCYLAVIESDDGIIWRRPSLNIYPHEELEINNVCLDDSDTPFVFYDENPKCPDDEKYKAVAPLNYEKEPGKRVVELWCYFSRDGYHFRRSHCIATDGHFDSLNTVHWKDGRYACYYRHFHTQSGEDAKEWDNNNIRDVRVMYSEDFRNWTKQIKIKFDDKRDDPLYTNNVIPYERAPHILIGFPTRYCERKKWTQNTEQLASSKLKKHLIETTETRGGLAVTDAIFMFSRDGENWHRYNQAFMRPGYENEHNWVYGDCYPAYGLIDSGRETYYMYTKDRHRSEGYPKPINRYEIRKDGFACYMADEDEKLLITKPFIFEGSELHINFLTSAYGYIYVDVLDENGNELSNKSSFEIYGDTIDRKVSFDDGTDFSEYSGIPIRLRFKMRDSKIFSLKFE